MGRGKNINKATFDAKEVIFSSALGDSSLEDNHIITEKELFWYEKINSQKHLDFIEWDNLFDPSQHYITNENFHKELYQQRVTKFKEALALLRGKTAGKIQKDSRVREKTWKDLVVAYKELLSFRFKEAYKEYNPEIIDTFKKYIDTDLDSFSKDKRKVVGAKEEKKIEYKIKTISLIDPKGESITVREDIACSLFHAVELRESGEEELIPYEISAMPLDLEDSILDQAYKKEIKVLLDKGYLEEGEYYDEWDRETIVYIPTEKCAELYKINALYVNF